MDNEILQAAKAYRRFTRQPNGVPTTPCKREGDDYCARFGLFARPELCMQCKSSDLAVRGQTVQRLRAATDCAERTPVCVNRSAPVDCPTNPAPLMVCPRYKLIVSDDICRRCKADPEFKQSLFASYIRNRAARVTPCAHATAVLGEESISCCGGKKTATIKKRTCERYGPVSDPDCWLCPDYAATDTATA